MSIEALCDAIEDAIDKTGDVYPITNGEIIAALETIKLNYYMAARENTEEQGESDA